MRTRFETEDTIRKIENVDKEQDVVSQDECVRRKKDLRLISLSTLSSYTCHSIQWRRWLDFQL